MRTRARSRRWSAAVGTAVLAAAALGTPAAAEEETPPGRCPVSAEGAAAAGVPGSVAAPSTGTPAPAPAPAPGGGTSTGAPVAGGGPALGSAATSGGGPALGGTSAPGAGVGPGGTSPPPEAGDGACVPPAAPLPVMNLRRVVLGAADGGPGARVRVTGAGFTPGAAVTVEGRAGTTRTADRARATADGRGALVVELPVTDRATTGVVAYEGPAWSPPLGAAPAPYTLVPAVAADPGALTMTQAGAAVTLGTVGYGGGGAAPGRIGTVTVDDTRRGGGGWKLTGKLTGFTGPDAAAPGAVLTWTPSCRGGCAPGAAGTVGADGAVLATGAAGAGTATVDAVLTLTLPAYTPPGAYRAVLTLTLSPAPS
ncbi:beta-xylosidase [Streptomyces sp. NPDC090077]|uniref:beta-xylosidase n=1 Tax=Streptomyces sp. NPDC090077 TaxID=3365938 RepID=UPI003829688F